MRVSTVVVLVAVTTLCVCTVGYGTYVAVVSSSTDDDGRAMTCANRCGDEDSSTGCQCSETCTDFGDCCSDYEEVCFSCANRCTDGVMVGAPCQCDSECASHGVCCQDYSDICGGTTIVGNITDEEISSLTEELYALDDDNLAAYVTIDIQGLTSSSATSDRAPLPLYRNVSSEAFNTKTVQLLETLRDNYIKDVTEPEDNTAEEQAEVTAFLDEVFDSPVMQRLQSFMEEKQILNASLRASIEQIWFTPYSRDGLVLGSSGFEHVFIGELNAGTVGGFHNWISVFREEQAGNVDYKGFIEYTDLGTAGYVFTSRFTWLGVNKPIGGGFIGTSPQFDLAMKTLCFYVRPNSLCPVQTNGRKYSIQTYDFDGKPLVGSAYPVVGTS